MSGYRFGGLQEPCACQLIRSARDVIVDNSAESNRRDQQANAAKTDENKEDARGIPFTKIIPPFLCLFSITMRQMFAKRTNWNLEANRLSAALAAHRAAGKSLIDLTLSNPTECGFEYDEAGILAALGNRASLKYEPNPRGLEAARAAVTRYYAARGSIVPIEDVFLTTSTSEAYNFVFRTLCDPGDELLIPTPSYPLFAFLADIQDVRLARYPLIYDHGWQIDFYSLEAAITERTRGVVVVNPNNPTGNFCRAQEIQKLIEISSAHGIAVIADEVFLDFALQGGRQASFAGNSGALTFALSGISKICGLPQMKAAWVAVSGPEPLKQRAQARLEVIADTYLSMSAPVQLALPKLLEQRHAFQRQVVARATKNLAALDDQLRQNSSCRRLEVEGGWNVVLRLPATRSDEELALNLLDTQGVYVHPGHFYDFSADGHLVVSLIVPKRDFVAGVARILAE